MNPQPIVEALRASLPELLAVYAFGSQVHGTAGPDSDLDLAVLVHGYVDPLLLWRLTGDLAAITACPVDLLDLRAASTVMQYQVITTGERWWASDAQAAFIVRVRDPQREDGARRSPRWPPGRYRGNGEHLWPMTSW